MDNDDLLCIVWLILCTPLTLIIPAVMYTIGINELVCQSLTIALYFIWVYTFTTSCLILPFALFSSGSTLVGKRDIEETINIIIFVIASLISLVVAYYTTLSQI